jgi:hypothetical protein
MSLTHGSMTLPLYIEILGARVSQTNTSKNKYELDVLFLGSWHNIVIVSKQLCGPKLNSNQAQMKLNVFLATRYNTHCTRTYGGATLCFQGCMFKTIVCVHSNNVIHVPKTT